MADFNSNDGILPTVSAAQAARLKYPSPNVKDYQVTPDELNYDPTLALPGAEDRGKATAQAAAGIQPTASAPAPAAPQRSLNDIEGAITGAPSGPVIKPPPIKPHQADISGSSVEGLQRAADAAGFDSSKVPKEYWEYAMQKYRAAYDPGTMDAVRNWIRCTYVGHLMAGWDSQGPQDVVPPSTMEKIHPGLAEMRKVDEFFNQNIQSRIVEKGQYISKDGTSYTPPKEYQIGRLVGSVMANPASAAALPAMAKQAVGATLAAGGKAAQTMGAFAEAHPIAANMVAELAKYTALGAIFKTAFGGGAVPPP